MIERSVLYQIDNHLRIVSRDENNVELQRFETRKGFQGKGTKDGWFFVGFYRNLYRALHAIHVNGLLNDETDKMDHEKLLKSISDSEQRILQAIREVQQ